MRFGFLFIGAALRARRPSPPQHRTEMPSPRDWADLPPHHPAAEATPYRSLLSPYLDP